MDHILRHGMWAPVETRIFHHIILVSTTFSRESAFGCLIFFLLCSYDKVLQKILEFDSEPLVVDVGMNVSYFAFDCRRSDWKFSTSFRWVISHFLPSLSALVLLPWSQQLI